MLLYALLKQKGMNFFGTFPRLTVIKTTPLSLYSSATSMMIGMALLQGPHHVAQKSRITMFLSFCWDKSNSPSSRSGSLKRGAGVPRRGWGSEGVVSILHHGLDSVICVQADEVFKSIGSPLLKPDQISD